MLLEPLHQVVCPVLSIPRKSEYTVEKGGVFSRANACPPRAHREQRMYSVLTERLHYGTWEIEDGLDRIDRRGVSGRAPATCPEQSPPFQMFDSRYRNQKERKAAKPTLQSTVRRSPSYECPLTGLQLPRATSRLEVFPLPFQVCQ